MSCLLCNSASTVANAPGSVFLAQAATGMTLFVHLGPYPTAIRVLYRLFVRSYDVSTVYRCLTSNGKQLCVEIVVLDDNLVRQSKDDKIWRFLERRTMLTTYDGSKTRRKCKEKAAYLEGIAKNLRSLRI
jgi:hypothetical protein